MRLIGLEPTRHQPLDPKSSASTNSATGADFLCFCCGIKCMFYVSPFSLFAKIFAKVHPFCVKTKDISGFLINFICQTLVFMCILMFLEYFVNCKSISVHTYIIAASAVSAASVINNITSSALRLVFTAFFMSSVVSCRSLSPMYGL